MAWSLRRLRGPGSVFLLAVLLAGTFPAMHVAAADGSKVLKVGLVEQPDTMNPFAGFGGSWMVPFTYELLVGNGTDRDGVLPKYFASSWEASNGGKTWTYHIDPAKKWSDGTPATARDAEYTLRYIMDTKGTPNELNLGFDSTVYFDGLVGNSSDIRATDDQTLQIDLLRPQADPPYFFSFILPQHVLKDITPADAATMQAVSADGKLPVVGSGDFIATEWQSGKFLRLVRNPYQTMPGGVQELIFVYFGNPEAEVTALKAGEIDLALDAPVATLPTLSSDPNIALTSVVVPQYTLLAFNTAKNTKSSSSALSDPAFRDALGYAIDNQELVDKVRQGNAQAGLSLVSPSLSGFWEGVQAKIGSSQRTFDLAVAKAKLEAAGYRDSNGDGVREDKDGKPISLRLYVRADQAELTQVAQFLADWFKEAGVEITTTALERGTLSTKIASPADGGGDWDMFMRMFWPNPAPSDVLLTGLTRMIGTENWSYWSNPEYDALWEQQDGTVDRTQRIDLVAKAVSLFYAEAPEHILYYSKRVEPHRTDKFTNWLPASVAEIYPDQVIRALAVIGEASASPAATDAPSSAAPSASAVATAAPSASGDGTTPASSDGPPVALIVVVVVGVLVAVLLVLRSRRSS